MVTICGVAPRYDSGHVTLVMDTAELLRRIDAKGIKPADMARAMNLPASRISEIRKGTRAVKLDEAARLVAAFGLEQSHAATPLPASVLRLAVRHVALKLQVQAQEAQIAELAEDLRAFSEYAANPKVRQSIEAAEGFFQALQLRRSAPEEEARQETDHESDQRPSR